MIINKTKAKVNLALVRRITRAFLSEANVDKEVSVIFVGEKEIRDLNRLYRRRDRVTDVLSFSEIDSQTPDRQYLGDLFVCLPQIKKQAKDFSHSIDYELTFIVVHGLLHLLGYNDRTKKEAESMKSLGEAFIEKRIKIKEK